MATATINNQELTDFATQVYEDSRVSFIQAIGEKIKQSVEVGEAQFENGEYMGFDEFKTKFIKEHSLDGKL
jgi:hypothetical protein